MPIREYRCNNKKCVMAGYKIEHYLPLSSSPCPPCESCGGPTEQLMSMFCSAFSGDITSKYNDKSKENAWEDGHFATNRDGTQERITSWQQQKEFCKRNGFINPRDVGVMEAGADGKSASFMGLPGVEV